MAFTYFSPAKVNLFFKIINKRSDGYHNIASLLQTISLHDIITFQKAKKDAFHLISSNQLDLKFDNNNLIVKAINLFREKTNILDPLQITLKKNIPVEAGLGGGSSNAATTLFALNEIFLHPLSMDALKEIASKIGADVSFFFSNGRAFCTGIGNIFEDVKLIEKKSFFIAKPSFGMSTKKVYQNVKVELLLKSRSVEELKKSVFQNNVEYFNDLEISAFEIEPKLLAFKNDLINEGFEIVMMTGSGSSFICMNPKNKFFKKTNLLEVFPIQRNEKNWYSII